MAGSTDSEEGNYWPGYVDALTAMVKVLTFVMMLLSVAVFAISQQVSKGAVEKIAKALNIETSTDANVKELTERVVNTVKAAKAESVSKSELPVPPSDLSSARTDTAAIEAEARRGAIRDIARAAGVSLEAEQDIDAAAQKLVEELQRREDSRHAAVSAPSLEAVAPETRPPAIASQETKTLTSAAAPVKGFPEGPVQAAVRPEMLMLKFGDGIVQLDSRTIDDIRIYLQDKKSATFSVSAYASSDRGTVTVGRRIAFYRTMAVRQAFIAAGVKPDQMKLNVRDTASADDGRVVRVSMD